MDHEQRGNQIFSNSMTIFHIRLERPFARCILSYQKSRKWRKTTNYETTRRLLKTLTTFPDSHFETVLGLH